MRLFTRFLLAGCLLSTIAAFSVPEKPKRTFLQNLDQFLTKLQNPQEQLKRNLYLKGNYAPVAEEHTNIPVTVVEGSIPSDLRGLLCRNGPNPGKYLTRRYHWFDGHAMLHNLRFSADGRVYYTNCFVPSKRYELEQTYQQDFFPTLGDYTGLIGFLKILFHTTMIGQITADPAKTSSPPNTNCLLYRDKFYCLNEGNVPFECRILRDGRLAPVGYEYFNNTLDYPISAHPRIDTSGDLLFHSYSINAEALQRDGPLKVGRYSAATNSVESYFGVRPNEAHISFAHNLMFTTDYIIVYDCSVHFEPKAMFDGGSFFRSNPAYPLRFGLIPKNGSEEVLWIDTGQPAGIVHPLNAWQEEENTVVIWTPVCKNLDLDLETKDINVFHMVEYRLDVTSGTVVRETVIDDTVNVEFSVCPVMGERTQFGYTAIQDPSTPGEGSFCGFCIWDMHNRRVHATVYYSDGEVGGEPMILQSQGGRVYVGVYQQVLDTDESFFCLYDGKTTELVTRLQMPHRVPYGFHGCWLGEEELERHFQYHEQTTAKDNGLEVSELVSS